MKTVPAWVGSLILVAIAALVADPDVNAAGKGSKGGGGHSSAAHAAASHSAAQTQAWHQAAASRQAAARQAQQSTGSLAASSAVGSGQVTSPYRNGSGRVRNYGNRSQYRTNRGYSYGTRYAMANQNIRSIVNRLRQTHATLARVSHTYQGHRVQAMHAISRAVQQLTHRGSTTSGMNAMGMNAMGMNRNGANGLGGNALMGANGANGLGANGANGLGANAQGLRNRAGAGVGGGAGRTQTMSQAQSDARMQRALRNLQGVHTQLTAQGSTANHVRARGSVQTAMRELHVALTVR
jgi:hypothetical protein